MLDDVNVPKPIVHLLPTEVFDPDVGAFVPRVYNFAGFEVPNGLVVRATGRFGLRIRATGEVTIAGTLDVSGDPGEVIDPTQLDPGMGGVASLGGADGGMGGSMTTGAPSFTPTISGTGFGGAGYQDASAPNQGLTGISTAITDFTLDRHTSFGPSPSGWTGLWIQPNVGTGVDTTAFPSASPGDQINHNHPRVQGDRGRRGPGVRGLGPGRSGLQGLDAAAVAGRVRAPAAADREAGGIRSWSAI